MTVVFFARSEIMVLSPIVGKCLKFVLAEGLG
jgi:hypothetical protein